MGYINYLTSDTNTPILPKSGYNPFYMLFPDRPPLYVDDYEGNGDVKGFNIYVWLANENREQYGLPQNLSVNRLAELGIGMESGMVYEDTSTGRLYSIGFDFAPLVRNCINLIGGFEAYQAVLGGIPSHLLRDGRLVSRAIEQPKFPLKFVTDGSIPYTKAAASVANNDALL